MTVRMTLAFVVATLSLLGFALRAPRSGAESTKAPAKRSSVTLERDPLDALARTPVPFLLNQNQDDPADFQQRGDPNKWPLQQPFDLSGPAPTDEAVRSAIVFGVNYVLEKQNANGSWDVELTGSMLSETADQAVDAVAITALCGIALRSHTKVDPVRVENALQKATDFIVSRVIRGKLSTKVYYAVWRYSWGLRFLTGEYQITKDQARKDDLKSCAQRMVQSLISMQLSNSKEPRLDRKRKAKMAKRLKTPMPAEMGLVLELPTDDNFRGGAVVTSVLPGSPAEKGGLKAGDKIVRCEDAKIENAYDYYMMCTEWIGGQTVKIDYTRPSDPGGTKKIPLPQSWPGYIGIKVGGGTGEGPTVDEFLKFSPSKKELKLGDVIVAIGKDKVTNLDEYRTAEAKIKPGDRVKFQLLRAGKKVSETVEATASPEGNMGFLIREEDKEDLGGVVIEEVPDNSPAAAAGLLKDDRLIAVDSTPILGLDHFINFIGTLAAGKVIKCKVLRGGAEQVIEMQLSPIALPGDPTFDIDFGPNLEVIVSTLTKGGVAERAGVKLNMQITKVNGVATPTLREFLPYWWDAGFSAGDEVTFTMKLGGGREQDFKIELQKPVYKEEALEVGGWAYYPDQGVAASFCTATTLINLYAVQQVMGIKIPKKEVLDPAAAMLKGILHTDVTNGNIETWLYEVRIKEEKDARMAPAKDVRGCMGRNAVCELAMVIAGKRSKGDLKKTLDTWLKYRSELDKVRDYWYTHHRTSIGFYNAAYYWLFGHYHSVLAANYMGGAHKKKVQEVTLKALMLKRNKDGTWNDHESFGALVGTSEALMILGEIEGGFRDGYSASTQGNSEKPPEKAPEEKPPEGEGEGETPDN